MAPVTSQSDDEAALQLTKKTTTNDRAPFVSVVAIIGAIGGLGIPLTFAWDELGQRAAKKRHVELVTRDSRDVVCREVLHAHTSHFVT